jgi:AraC family transcriptional regulator, alkane utilization regulator
MFPTSLPSLFRFGSRTPLAAPAVTRTIVVTEGARVLPWRSAFLLQTPELHSTISMDVLSDSLRVIRLKGALFLNADFREPWCVAAPSGEDLSRILATGHPHMAICHLVVEGRCWAQLPDGESVALEAGDVVVLPRGDKHIIGSGVGHAPVAVRDAVALKLPGLARVRYGGDGAATILVCGWFGYERRVASPVMPSLPRMFRANVRGRPSGAWLESSIRYAVGEATSSRAGADVIADRLAEVLFIEALRGYIDALPDGRTGWLAAIADPLVGRSIALLHERPAHAWTVASLAQTVSASRTVLAERFVALVGVPPMHYLTQWRTALAAHLLRDGQLSLTRIAEQVGYESEAAFSRAFKREYGAAPGAWRRRVADPDPRAAVE